MSKWRVRRTWNSFYFDYCWEVRDPDGIFECEFDTWHEAMRYASRLACSTPPRGDVTKYWHVRRRGNDYAITRYKRDRSSQTIHVAPADLQPLADLLLAAHFHEERSGQ